MKLIQQILRRLPAILALTISTTELPANEAQESSPESDDKADVVNVVLNKVMHVPFHSEITGRDYLLYIAYPDSYASSSDRHYPVVYMTDAYWNFQWASTTLPDLWAEGATPEFIMVGIGYDGENINHSVERMYELAPTKQSYGWESRMGMDEMGNSRKFLNSIRDEIIPYMETNSRADPSFRVMAGTSLGGLFSLFCLYEEPGLFQGIVASSPAVDWDHLWLVNREHELKMSAMGEDEKGLLALHSRLYMCVGENEWPLYTGAIMAFDQIIKSSSEVYEDFAYKFGIIEGEDHGGSVPEAYKSGLTFAFAPYTNTASN